MERLQVRLDAGAARRIAVGDRQRDRCRPGHVPPHATAKKRGGRGASRAGGAPRVRRGRRHAVRRRRVAAPVRATTARAPHRRRCAPNRRTAKSGRRRGEPGQQPFAEPRVEAQARQHRRRRPRFAACGGGRRQELGAGQRRVARRHAREVDAEPFGLLAVQADYVVAVARHRQRAVGEASHERWATTRRARSLADVPRLPRRLGCGTPEW